MEDTNSALTKMKTIAAARAVILRSGDDIAPTDRASQAILNDIYEHNQILFDDWPSADRLDSLVYTKVYRVSTNIVSLEIAPADYINHTFLWQPMATVAAASERAIETRNSIFICLQEAAQTGINPIASRSPSIRQSAMKFNDAADAIQFSLPEKC